MSGPTRRTPGANRGSENEAAAKPFAEHDGSEGGRPPSRCSCHTRHTAPWREVIGVDLSVILEAAALLHTTLVQAAPDDRLGTLHEQFEVLKRLESIDRHLDYALPIMWARVRDPAPDSE